MEDRDIINLVNALDEKEICRICNDIHIEDVEAEKLTDIKKRKILNKFNKKINKKKINKSKKMLVAASLSFALLTGVTIVNPTWAKSIPGIRELIEVIEKQNKLPNSNGYIKYSKDVNLKASDKGIDIELKSIIYDDASLKLMYELKSDKGLKYGIGLYSIKMFIDDKEISGVTDITKDASVTDDKTKFYAISRIDLPNIDLKDTSKIRIVINNISNIDGNWEFKFEARKDELKKEVTSLKPNLTLSEYKGARRMLEKVTFTPMEIKLFSNTDKNSTDIINKITQKYDEHRDESKINKEDLNVIDTRFNSAIPYIVLTDSGKELDQIDSLGRDRNDGSYMQFDTFKPLSELPNKLILVPYDYINREDVVCNETNGKLIDLDKVNTKIEISQGKNRELVINTIKNEDGTISLEGEFKGNYPKFRNRNTVIDVVEVDNDGRILNTILPQSQEINTEDKCVVKEKYKIDINKKYKLYIGDINKYATINENEALTIQVK